MLAAGGIRREVGGADGIIDGGADSGAESGAGVIVGLRGQGGRRQQGQREDER